MGRNELPVNIMSEIPIEPDLSPIKRENNLARVSARENAFCRVKIHV